jgi:hypothetical protein
MNNNQKKELTDIVKKWEQVLLDGDAVPLTKFWQLDKRGTRFSLGLTRPGQDHTCNYGNWIDFTIRHDEAAQFRKWAKELGFEKEKCHHGG